MKILYGTKYDFYSYLFFFNVIYICSVIKKMINFINSKRMGKYFLGRFLLFLL